MEFNELSPMIGQVITSIDLGPHRDRMVLVADSGDKFTFEHHQDCCEDVSIEDIVGDLDDLLGSPLVLAEEVSSVDAPEVEGQESYTWTFYRFGTIKGAVTVRWFGSSNGYYSEGVSFEYTPAPTCTIHSDCKEDAGLARACYLSSLKN